MGVTIREVAQRAKVSISTVSRVLNDTCNVREDKRIRVLEAAAELGYTPNPAAQSLHSMKTGAIGILLPYVSGEFYAELLNGIDAAAQEEGRLLLISTSHNSEEELEAAMKGMYRRVDGILVMAPVTTAEAVMARAPRDIPLVFMNTSTSRSDIPLLSFDNYGGMRAMAEHLISRGHRKIGFITGPSAAFDAQERFRGYREALHEAGIPLNEDYVVDGEYTQRAGYEAAQYLLGLENRPSAIMASNDDAALGAMRALREGGISIPEGIALTGYDDIPSSAFTSPALTTVHVPVRELGNQAVRMLEDAISAGQNGFVAATVLPVELRVRQST